MATEKPRLSISMDEDTFAKVLAYKKEKGIATQSKAIIQIMEMGLKDLEREAMQKQKNSPSTSENALGKDPTGSDSLRSILLHNFEQLNQEGRERLVETSDDMVSSGKYIKTSATQVGGEKLA